MTEDTLDRKTIGGEPDADEGPPADPISNVSGSATNVTSTDAGTATSPVDDRTVAEILTPAIEAILPNGVSIQFEFWDGSTLGDDVGPGRAMFRSPDGLRRVLAAPGQLGFARAYVNGEVDVEGPLAPTIRVLLDGIAGEIRVPPKALPILFSAARSLGAIGKPPAPPPEETRPRGVRHSISRDKQVVSHHYNVGNDFYRLVLGPSMTYSCARFETIETSLEDAQRDKHLLIGRKLGLDDPAQRVLSAGDRPRLLDVGCGWGTMAIDAAREFDVDVVGVTISDEQAARARERVREAGLDHRIEIRIQDYREIPDGPFDAISSIGMAEHVGMKRMPEYFGQLYGLLRPGGRLLNHAISSVGGSKLPRRSFVYRYVFPDGELLDVGDTVLIMERAGFEVRDVENLREHYARTLQHWVANLEAEWDRAVALVGERRARVWRLYMSGSINGFLDGGVQIHQTLGVRTHPDGASDIPLTRIARG